MLNNHLYTFSEIMEKGVLVPLEEDKTYQTPETELIFKNLNGVVVPMIQRPYAQGRKSEYETKVRENFLDDLFKVIKNENESLELNFVYGVHTKEDNLELLDGQQRLTTLFLLYWYAFTTNESEDKKLLDNLRKFTYKTRTTSTQFLDKLLKEKISLKSTPSKDIRKKPWYTCAFSKDSTITGMLTMLDAIHDKVSAELKGKKLEIKDLDRLKFYLLELKNFGRADDLFIKMNARGLQLTPFENFKAELTGWIKDSDKWGERYKNEIKEGENLLPFWLSFSAHLDGNWVDLFWEMPKDESGNPVIDCDNLGASQSDNQFFTFIKRWLANRSLTMTSKAAANSENSFFFYFAGKADENFYHSFEEYKKLIEQGFSLNIDLVRELYKTLKFLSDKNLGPIILKKLCPPWLEDDPKYKANYQPWAPQLEMRPMIIFSAIVDFILSQPDSPENFNIMEFNRWMRLVHNIVQNRDVNSAAIQITLTRQLHRIIEHKKIEKNSDSTLLHLELKTPNEDTLTLPIYQRFVDYVNNLEGNLLSRELTAEKDKILLILKDEKWEEALINAEKDSFMTGSVSFYIDENTDISTFKKRTERVPLIFNEKGIIDDLRKNYSLIRSILSRSFDFSKFKLPGYHFQICNQNLVNRFLKNMTVWNDNPEVKEFFRNLFDIEDYPKMKEYINLTAKECKDIIPNENYDPEIICMQQKGFKRLIEDSPTNALKWLEDTGEKAMGVYFYKNGEMALFKGSVNCMFLNSYREEFLDSLFKSLVNDGFKYEFVWDKRPLENYKKYGLYSGERPLRIRMMNDKLEFIVLIYWNMTCKIFFANKELADSIISSNDELISGNPVQIYFEDLTQNIDKLEIEVLDNNPFYLGIQLNDIRNLDTIPIIKNILKNSK